MEPIAQTLQYDPQPCQSTGQWGLLPDELVLQVFGCLNTLERVKTLRTCIQFNNLGTDRALLKTDVAASKQMLKTFIDHNKELPLAKRLKDLNLTWADPWTDLQTIGKTYKFEGMPLHVLAGITLSLENIQDHTLFKLYQERYHHEVRKRISETQGVLRIESGCKFTDESFRVFMYALARSCKIDKLAIMCDLTTNQIEMLAESMKWDRIKIPEVFIKSEQKFSRAELILLFSGLAENSTIRSFQFYDEIAYDVLPIVNQALEKNQGLEKICLNGQMFDVTGFNTFMTVLQGKPKIKKLGLKAIILDDILRKIFNDLHLTSLEELDLHFLDVSHETTMAVAEGILRNPQLRVFDFPKTNFSTDDAKILIRALDEHPHLKSTRTWVAG